MDETDAALVRAWDLWRATYPDDSVAAAEVNDLLSALVQPGYVTDDEEAARFTPEGVTRVSELWSHSTLDDLDPPAWGPPTYGSHLVTRCHELRKKAVASFTVEDLRIMIGQSLGLPFLMPLAIEALKANPLAEGGFYAGDLLHAVLTVDQSHWRNFRFDWDDVREIIDSLTSAMESLGDAIQTFETIEIS